MLPLTTTFLLMGIRIYRTATTLLGISSPCRFYPTCSIYAQRAIERYGPFAGARMTAGRLFRCHPWNPGGIDLPEAENP